jgi:hypothetical protein
MENKELNEFLNNSELVPMVFLGSKGVFAKRVLNFSYARGIRSIIHLWNEFSNYPILAIDCI